jgi:hypothetical protein
LRWIAWSVPALLVIAIVGLFVARSAIASYLRSERFRDFLARRAGTSLHAQAEVAPLSFTGLSVYGDSFRAHGGPGAAFGDLRIEGIRAELSLRRFFERVWQVDSVNAERVRIELDTPRITLPELSSAPAPAREEKVRGPGWFPNRVEIAQANASDVQLRWAGGGVSGLVAQLTPQEGGWKITGAGGRLEQTGQPTLEVETLRLLHRSSTLFVQSAELRQPGGGTVRVSGDVNFGQALALRAELDGISITPFLAEDWRLRLRGKAAGEVNVSSPLPSRGPPEIRGTLTLADGELEALPVLDEIALFTRTQQFRRLKLTRASADFQHAGSLLAISNFVAEAERLIRVEGRFTVEHGMIDGTFQVGVTAASLQWLPGSQERVFTLARDGYLWTPMRLTGPIDKPTDDLTPRLAAALGEAVIDTAQGTMKDAIKTGKDVLKSALDLLLPPPK